MAELGNILAIVLAVNVMLWLGQVAALNLNPEGPQFYNCQGSIISTLEASHCAGNEYVLRDEDPASFLPSEGSEISVDSGAVYTDTASASNNWLTQTPGLNYLYSILAAPSNFLKALGVPSAFAFGVGVLWYGFSLLVLVAFALGRDY